MFVLSMLISVIIGYLRHGKLKNLEYLSIKLWYLLSLAFLIQIFAIRITSLKDLQFYILHLISYAIIMYICFVNRKFFAVQLLAIGNLCNALVIALNNGQMPVKVPEFVENPLFDRGHTLLDTTTKVPFLADIFLVRIPAFKLYMLSVGDVFLMIGVFILIQHGMCMKFDEDEHCETEEINL